MNNVLIRSLFGSLYIAAFVAAIWLPPASFGIFLTLIYLFSLRELQGLKPFPKGIRSIILVLLQLIAFIISLLVLLFKVPIYYLAAYLALVYASVYLFSAGKKHLKSALKILTFQLVYLAFPLLCLLQTDIRFEALNGFVPIVLYILILIWLNDTMAFVVGSLFGKHRLWERISPKKSWEGAIGGLVFVLLLSVWAIKWMPGFNLAVSLGLGFLVAVSSVVGDLFESSLKRKAGIKDSGRLIPGHGGILDRIDSLLFVSPVVFIYLRLVVG